MQTIKCWLSLCIMLTTLLKSCHDMFTAALRPRCYYALTLNQWWCDKLIRCAVIVIVLHTFFQALPWQRRWKGLPAQCFFFVIVILFLIAYYLNICLKMKTEINHNRKKDKKKKKKSQLRSIRPQSFSSSSSSDALLLDMNLLWLFKAFFFFFSLLKCVIPAPRTSAVRRVQLLVNKAASLFRGFTDS